MKKLFLVLFFYIAALSGFPQNSEKRIALVIGNAAYQNGSALKNPVNDANLMASTLKSLGFEIILITNASLKTMQMVSVDFTNKIGNYDVALFFYAGHGIQLDGINYLVPIDAMMDNREMAKYEAFSINDINDAFMANGSKINIMILDACRNNPFSWTRGGERGFTKIDNPSKGTIIAFATQPGSTASDDAGENGLYTSKLVQQMKIPQSIENVFKKTRIAVNNASDGKQVPQDWSSLMDDFYFKRETENSDQNVTVSKTKDLPNLLIDKRDNKYYKTVKIGSQVWMAENLAFNYGSGCWAYDNDQSNVTKYGYLYNWETAKNVCPTGWHLPSKAEFETLINNSGGSAEAAYRSLIPGGNSGFSAPFGVWRSSNGNFGSVGEGAHFWSSTPGNDESAWHLEIKSFYSEASMGGGYFSFGFSVRCLQDN